MGEQDSVFYYKNGTYNRAESATGSGNQGKNQQQLPERNTQISMKRNEAKSGSVITIILVSILAAVMLGSVVYTLDKRNTVYNKVSSLNSELNLAEAENVRLQSELESKMSAKNVEDYAENVLGMIKISSSQIEYIKIQTDDVVNIPQQEESIGTKIKKFFDKCVEYFRG
jgi:cell division protein FtsL